MSVLLEENKRITSYDKGDIVIVNGINELEYKVSSNSKMTILLMCKQGKIQISMDEKQIIMQKSDLLFILPNTRITNLMFSADIECSAICLRTMRVDDFLQTQDLLNIILSIRKRPLLHVSDEQFRNLLNLKEYITQIFSSNHPYYEQIISHFVEIILYDIFGSYKASMEEIIPGKVDLPNRTSQLFTTFINLLQQDKGIHRDVSYYADKLCVTSKHFSTICKNVSGKSCSQWITETVTDEIKHLLRYTDLSIKEIAEKLQFENHSFFSKYVRKNIGCTPTDYRLRFRTSDSNM